MKISTEKIPDSQVLMTIEVEQERLAAARGQALRKLAPRAKVPGFRPGKAPPAMVERFLGEERIFDEALDALVPDIYREALAADESIHPIARPAIEVAATEPLVLKATIPVRPTIELGDYQAIRVQTEAVAVEESRVDDALLALRRRQATLEPIERELRWQDVARLDVSGLVDGESLVDQQDVEVQLIEARDVLFPGFEEELIGHRKGETFEFDLAVPETIPRPEMAHKTCHFTLTLKETKEEVLPELNDEFAKGLGDAFASVDALKARIRDDIRDAERDRIEDRYHDEILGELVDRSTIEFPPVMLDTEVERLLQDQMRDHRFTEGLERYLALVGKTEEQAREELRPVAGTRLRRSLTLSKVAEAEHIEAADGEIDAEVERLAGSGPNADELRKLFGSDDGRDTLRRNIMTRKTLAKLVEIATQDGPSPPAHEDEPPAKPSRRKRGGSSAEQQAPGTTPAAAAVQTSSAEAENQ